MNKFTLFLSAGAMSLASCGGVAVDQKSDVVFSEAFEFNPKKYICYKVDQKIKIDGNIDDSAWESAPWTDFFVDIEGGRRSVEPRFKTQAKMLWDDEYLYVAAYLEEPDVWAKLTEREAIIYYDNDFEVFIDPDGDSHYYMEFEMNAFATEWDLMLTKPYRDRGMHVLNAWNINGMKSATHIDGTINNGNDKDKGWSVEIAMPIKSLIETGGAHPAEGVQWRINFSRVEWYTEWDGKTYNVIANKDTGRKVGSGGEDNWVWSPQGVIAMHQPETWGFMQFSDKNGIDDKSEFVWNKNEAVKWALRKLYYRMHEYHSAEKALPENLSQIKANEITVDGLYFNPELSVMENNWEIAVDGFEGKRVYIASDGKTWIIDKK